MKTMNAWRLYGFLLIVLMLVLAGCREEAEETPTSQPTATAEQVEPEAEATEEVSAAATATTEVAATEEPPAVEEEPIYLAIIWHQHQPVYYKDPETGIYAKPWVRVHATKDYVDMAAILEEYPDVHATFNLTPSLIRQLDDLAGGTKDLYWVYSEIPAGELTEEQKQFILDRFFDTNREIIGRFPRYQELLDLRDGSEDAVNSYSEQDFRDLQIMFNLAWVDPAWLAEEPLAGLVAKGRDYDEADKEVLFAEHRRLIEEVIPFHRELQAAGQIEVTMTPFAHPILPLLVNSDLAREAMPEAQLPAPPFIYGQDARAQVEMGVALYEEHFGQAPRGMWPAEGSVAEEIVTMVAQNGIQWMASDEGVLAASLGMNSFTRDAEDTVQEADALYRPYQVQGLRGGPVAMVFRDVVISDKVGFTYSGMAGEAAATDFVERIHAIRERLQASGEEGPHLVPVILDGENAWEHYENDGKEFLHTLYQQLSADPLIKTVTPSEYLALAPEPPMLEDLWAGSWINHDFSTWIGEDEENRGWEYLRDVREWLQPYLVEMEEAPSAEALEEALTLMYIAEGSDWFWWYGSDQNSGDDGSFDLQFRNTLKGVYQALEEEPPQFLDVPIIPERPVTADQALTGLISPTINGVEAEGEWEEAGLYLAEGGVMATAEPVFESAAYGFDGDNLYLKVAFSDDVDEILGDGELEIYLSVPGSDPAASFSDGGSLLGFPAQRQVELSLVDGALQANMVGVADGIWAAAGDAIEQVAAGERVLEMAIPLEQLNGADVGDRLAMRAIFAETVEAGGETTVVEDARVPGGGPGVIVVPDLGNVTVVLQVNDPLSDDYGPGSYSYAEDPVFTPGSFDIDTFQVGYDEESIIFKFVIAGPVENVWDSPNGLSIQTLDVYVDQEAGGGEAMLPGRNLAFSEGFAWDYAVTVEGWTSGVYIPTDDGGQEQVAQASDLFVLADPGQRQVTVRVPKSILGDNPEAWAYAAVMLGQEGFPSGGVMRVRDVQVEAEQYRFGGAPAGSTNHTRVMDLVWPEEGQQEAWLSEFAPADTGQTELTAADFARVPMIPAPE